MSTTPLVVVILLAVLVIGNEAQCDTRGRTNGCSIPGNLPYFYKNLFRPDCDVHDVCYACGRAFVLTRQTCDSRFYADLLSRCDTVSSRGFCRSIAKTYYSAVRKYGEDHYEDPSLAWCSENWVAGCL